MSIECYKFAGYTNSVISLNEIWFCNFERAWFVEFRSFLFLKFDCGLVSCFFFSRRVFVIQIRNIGRFIVRTSNYYALISSRNELFFDDQLYRKNSTDKNNVQMVKWQKLQDLRNKIPENLSLSFCVRSVHIFGKPVSWSLIFRFASLSSNQSPVLITKLLSDSVHIYRLR